MYKPVGDRLFKLFRLLNSNPESPLITFESFIHLLAIIYKGTLEEKC